MGRIKVKGISNSMIGAFDKSPQHLLMMLERTSVKQDYLTFGSAFHKWILEPEDFEKEFILASNRPKPESTFAATINIEWREEMQANGFEVIGDKDFAAIKGMKESCMRNNMVKQWLEDPEKLIEKDVQWVRDGIPYKGRYDLKVRQDLIDFKTTQDASENFVNSVRAFGYYRQAAMYLEGTGAEKFYIVAIEKRPPHLCRVFEMSREWIEKGMTEYLEKGPIVWHCIENDLYDQQTETKILKL